MTNNEESDVEYSETPGSKGKGDGILDAVIEAGIAAMNAKLDELGDVRLIVMVALSSPDAKPNTVTALGLRGGDDLSDEYDVQQAVVGLSLELAQMAANQVGVGVIVADGTTAPAGPGPVMN